MSNTLEFYGHDVKDKTMVVSRKQRIGVAATVMLAGTQAVMACDHPVGRIASMEGVVEVRAAAPQGNWTPAKLQQPLCANDQVAVRERSRAAVQFSNQIVVRLDQRTTLTIQNMAGDQPAELGLVQGVVHVLTRFANKFSVITPYLNAMVEGTEFVVSADAQAKRTQIMVAEGRVRAVNAQGEQLVVPGNAVVANAQAAPASPLTIKPREAIQWALYYPQIMRLRAAELATLSDAARALATAAQQLANRGAYTQALAMVADSTELGAAAALRPWRANLLLSVGRVDEARAMVTDASALPLRSLIETALGNRDAALQLAQQAVQAEPQSASASLALSLARQAQGDLAAALDAARQATGQDADFALAWVHLAELELLNANARQGRAHAQRALQLDANTLRADTVIGFADLMAGNYPAAASSFERAKQAVAPDAQAWLGSALVKIHAGEVKAAREQLELAVMLDPGNAELRNVLARAYALEQRNGVADKALDLAQRLDPNNPGSWFTEAMFKQQRNDPVGALHAYQQSLNMNDHKAVVRPRSLLDQDRAGRMLSLASTYRDLGFDGLMLTTAERAVAADPGSAAAHALLADAYTVMNDAETARVSEQLQAQLRAPIGMAPVPPASLVTTLPIVGGARAFTLQEYTPLLDRNRVGLTASVLGGNQSTRGSSVAAFKAWDRVQLSVGQFYYHTDIASSDRPVRLTFNNALLQVQIAPELQLQLEGRTERRDGGDVTQRINPLSAEPERRRYLKNDSARFGLAYAPSAQTQWLFSAVHRDQLQVADDVSREEFFPGVQAVTRIHSTTPVKADTLELQQLLQRGHWLWLMGAGLHRDHSDSVANIVSELSPPLFPPQQFDITTPVDVNHRNGYAYAGYRVDNFHADAGLSWDDFKREDQIRVRRFSPKLGLSYAWRDTQVHAAFISGVKGSYGKQQLLEPTHFAGIRQVFDDQDGSYYRGGALAVTHSASEWLHMGATVTHRRVYVPNSNCLTLNECFSPWREDGGRLNASWVISPRWVADAELERSHVRVEHLANFDFPVEVKSWHLPIALAFFPDHHWMLSMKWHGVKQKTYNTSYDFSGLDPLLVVNPVSSSFGVLDAMVRFKSSAGRLVVSLAVNNLLDREFRYQGTHIGDQPKVPIFMPQRLAALQLSVRL